MIKYGKRGRRGYGMESGRGGCVCSVGCAPPGDGGIFPLPTITRTAEGKPGFSDHPGLHFSLSHSGGRSLCVLGGAPVGADIERVRPRSKGLARYVMDDREYSWFQARGSGWGDFYTLWTLKEARVKCTGEGIFRGPVRQISVPLLEPGGRADWEGFSFVALSGEDWRGAVCLKIL